MRKKSKSMLIQIHGAKCIGIQAFPVVVEVEITNGIGIHLVGLADAAVKESLLRTVTALQACGFHIPGRKIIINLAPADMQKKGGGYDLPIAVGIIAASGQRRLQALGDYLIMGELGLDGGVRPVSGALPMAELAVHSGLRGCILPEASALEAADTASIDVYAVRTLSQVLDLLDGDAGALRNLPVKQSAAYIGLSRTDAPRPAAVYFADIIGQSAAKRGLEIAAAGQHNAMLIGAPGSGKSSLAKALPGILPPMTTEEALLTSKIYSVAGLGNSQAGLRRIRPFRAPHISASKAAMLGGGSGENILPGEVSLAHGGVLFVDEFCEAPKSVLESLRAPLEERRVCVSRLKSKVEYPASFMLVGASNPCPCGYYGEGDRCCCSPGVRAAYLGKLSGPLMDRIDIQLWLHPVKTSVLVSGAKEEPSAVVAERVLRAREIQQERFRGCEIFSNAEMGARELERFCPLGRESRDLLEQIIDRLGLSARAYTRIIKIARTIADLSGEPHILPAHLSEAASYRFLDRRQLLEM